MIYCYWDSYSRDYNDNCKEVSLDDLVNLIKNKKHFEVKVLDSETNFKNWSDKIAKKRDISFVASREVLDSSVIYLNYRNGRTSKVWVYNLQSIDI